MAEEKTRFIKMMKMEVEDLQYHVEKLLEKAEQDRGAERITNYVYQENTSMLKNEECCLEQAIKDMDGMNLDDYQDLDTLISDVEIGELCLLNVLVLG